MVTFEIRRGGGRGEVEGAKSTHLEGDFYSVFRCASFGHIAEGGKEVWTLYLLSSMDNEGMFAPFGG